MRAAFLFLPLAGCQLILGIESATLDTTPDAAVPDAGYPNALVSVTNHHAWEGGSGTISWEIDPVVYFMENGAFATRHGQVDETVAIPVPQGDYFVRIEEDSPWPPYALTSSREVDLGEWVVGRDSERTWAGPSTRLQMEGSGLAPGWADRDSFAVYSTSLGLNLELSPGSWWGKRNSAPLPVVGATGGSVDVDWDGLPLPWATSEDNLWLVVLGDQTQNGQTMRVLRSLAPMALPPVTSGGMTTQLSGGFTGPGTTRTTHIDFRRSQFADLRGQVNPDAVVTMRAVTLRAQPPEMTGENSSSYSSPTLLWYDSGEDTDIDLGTLSFPNPFPSWIVAREVRYGYAIHTTLGGQMRDIWVTANVVADNDSIGPTTAPMLGAPRFPTVNGRGGFGDATNVGKNPVLAWMPPSPGTPNRYRIRVMRYTSPDEQQSVDIFVPGRVNQITIPPGVMMENAWHFFVIHAVTASGDAEREPFLLRLPYASTPVITGKFAVGDAPF